MGVRNVEELAAWRLSCELKLAVYELLRRPHVRKDLEFCRQISKSAQGVPSNLAEGFGRRSHREFARFVEIARGSLLETKDHLKDACDRGYVSVDELDRYVALWRRALNAVSGLLRYLRDTPEPGNWS